MDKVKAIEVLKPLVESYVDHANITMNEEDDDIADALEMDIEALKALDVPDTNVGDMISRQMAIDAPDEQIEQCNKALGSFDISPKDEYAIKVERASLEAYKEQLENMPSAQLEQNGKWIYNSPMTMKCDRCGFVIKDWDWHRFKYCPNCRADMRGREND